MLIEKNVLPPATKGDKIRKRRISRVTVILLILLAVIAGMLYVFRHVFAPDVVRSPVIESADRDAKWRADIEFVSKELPKRHKNLFFKLPEQSFRSQMQALSDEVQNRSDVQLAYELIRIVNSVGDSHTQASLPLESIYPLQFFAFEEGVYVIRAHQAYSDLIGCRLVSIGGIPVEELFALLTPLLPADNDSIRWGRFAAWLSAPTYLQLVGAVEADQPAKYAFERTDGITETRLIEAVDNNQQVYAGFLDAAQLPLYARHQDEAYWYELLDDRVLYVKYNRCWDDPDKPFKAFASQVLDLLERGEAQRLIIDVRDNGGGNSLVFAPLLSGIVKMPQLKEKGRLTVIIGRDTFSSAVLNAMDLRNQAGALIAGEPSGGKPNHYGEVKWMGLMNIKMQVSYSVKYFKNTRQDVEAILPDVRITPRAADYFAGVDGVMQALPRP